ncbi:MAG TPA: hypothetical protein DGK91_09710 [Clostridium sp.]|nr:hypothetical protein [Clostridia bacterium]HCW04759.1 hypothetical protein [Clostridium sp.]
MELPKGISEKSTINEIMVTYGEPTDKDISEDFSYYKYGDIFESVEFSFNGDRLTRLKVEYEPDDLK